MAHKVEIEKEHMAALLKNGSARWLLKEWLTQSGCLNQNGCDDALHNAYASGRRDLGTQLVQRIVKDFGWQAIDIIMKGA